LIMAEDVVSNANRIKELLGNPNLNHHIIE
jgi:hypothetical protein